MYTTIYYCIYFHMFPAQFLEVAASHWGYFAMKICWRKARGSFLCLAAQQCSGKGIRDIKKPRQANFSK